MLVNSIRIGYRRKLTVAKKYLPVFEIPVLEFQIIILLIQPPVLF